MNLDQAWEARESRLDVARETTARHTIAHLEALRADMVAAYTLEQAAFQAKEEHRDKFNSCACWQLVYTAAAYLNLPLLQYEANESRRSYMRARAQQLYSERLHPAVNHWLSVNP